MRTTIKVIALLFACFFPVCCIAQETIKGKDGFEIEDGQVIWRKIYNTDLTFEKLVSSLKETGKFEDTETTENKFTGSTKKLDADHKGAGYSGIATPMNVTGSNFKAFFLVEFKEGRYRVTVKNIDLIWKATSAYTTAGQSFSFDENAIKNDKKRFRDSFYDKMSKIYDYSFNKLFEVKQEQKKNQDW